MYTVTISRVYIYTNIPIYLEKRIRKSFYPHSTLSVENDARRKKSHKSRLYRLCEPSISPRRALAYL